MPPRPTIDSMSEIHRQKIDQLIIENAYGNYKKISAQLAEEDGLRVPSSLLQRYGARRQKYKAECDLLKAVTEESIAAVAAAGSDNPNIVNDALIRSTQHLVLLKLKSLRTDEWIDPADIAKLATSVVSLARASSQQKEWQSKVAKIAEVEEQEPVERSKSAGEIDANTLKRVREEVYGLF